MYHRVGEKRRLEDICLEDEACEESLGRCGDRPLSPKAAMEHEKRIRREIANSNERRRMQSINAGFASLKSLLPKQEGEKLSKAAILQHTADYVYQLEQEKTRLLSQNCQLKRLVNNHQQNEFDGNQSGGDSPREDRASTGCLETLETMLPSASVSPAPSLEDMQRELAECRSLLEQERSQRLKYEEYVKNIEGQIFIDKAPPTREPATQPPGRAFVVASNKELKMESLAPKPSTVTSVAPVVSLAQPLPLAPPVHLAPSNELDIKEENMEVDGEPLNSISCHVAQQPVALQTNHLPRKRFKPDVNSLLQSGTIVTVVSSKPSNSMSTVLDVHSAADIDVSTATDDVAIEDNQTVFIMNTNNSTCQKSLDTICEAIRHLEGEHMFPMEDQQSRLEEEVITEETYTVEEELQHQSVPQDHHEAPAEILKFAECAPTATSHPMYSSHAPSPHPLGGSMSNLTLQMMPSEPQEVPLELTTTHRGTEYHCIEGRLLKSQPVLSHSSSRPGVIVVKQT